MGIPKFKNVERTKVEDFKDLAKDAACNVSAGSDPKEGGIIEYLELFLKRIPYGCNITLNEH